MIAKRKKSHFILQKSARDALLGSTLSIALNTAGQVFFKSAINGLNRQSLVDILLSAEVWMGITLYGLSSVCWLWVLSRAPLSLAYPILSLSFPIVVAMSALFFGEEISIVQWLGVSMIVYGVSHVARS